MNAPDCIAAILAGGRSRRMGRPKHTLVCEGRSVLEHLAGRLRPHVREVLVVGEGLEEAGRAAGVRAIGDGKHRCEGPLAGLVAALHAAPAADVLVWPVDMPVLAPALPVLLARALALAPRTVAAVCADAAGRLQPLAGLYRAERARAPLEAALRAGERSVCAAVARLPLAVLRAGTIAGIDPALDSLAGCNTPAEWAEVQRRLRRAAGSAGLGAGV